MSQTKVQLIAPIGVVTATTLETTGVLTATTFVGDIAGTVTGITSTTDNLNLGIVTATSFAGDFTGIGSGLTGTPNIVAGIVTATKFVGNTPGTVSGLADGTNINAGIITATSFVGNLTGNAAGLSTTTAQLTLGIVTATSYSGSGANLSGVSAGPVAQQAVTANSGTTAIDLSSGNVIYMTQSSNTTVSFANTEGNTDVVYLIRVKDSNTTARTITWPSGFVWNGGTEPTLLQKSGGAALKGQTFKLTTRDNGATWYGVEVVNYDSLQPYELWGWGGSNSGSLGLNESGNYYRSSPVQVTGTNWASLEFVGGNKFGHGGVFGGLKSDGTLWGMGNNTNGQLGVNDRATRSSPVQIPGSWSYISVSNNSGSTSRLAIKTDGTLWGWGANNNGLLGLNDTTRYSSPVQVGSDTTWSKASVAAFYTSSFGIKTDNTLWSWGYNEVGQLGLNQAGHTASIKFSSPVQIPGTTWDSMTSNSYTTLATKTDGTLWGWGENKVGTLGLNQAAATYISSPTQIPGTTWSSVHLGSTIVTAIKTDGTLWKWGQNGYGQLGQNNNTKYSSPVQVGSATDWSMGRGSYAVKTDGTLWAVGWNHQGKLGQNDLVNYSSPVQIPGTTWNAVIDMGYNAYATKS